MNVVEVWLKDVISIQVATNPKYPNLPLVKVNAIWECYGNVRQNEQLFLVDEWKIIEEKGYYLA